jgi:serine protease AprX
MHISKYKFLGVRGGVHISGGRVMKKIALVVMLLAGTLAYANNAKMSPDLQASKAANVRVLVQYNQAPGLLDLNLLGTLGSILNALPLVNGIVAQLPLANILTLSNQSNVKYISLDRLLTPNLSNAAPAINAFAAWQSGYTGEGIGVALVDSGVSSHPDLNGGFLGLSRVVWNQSFVSGNLSAADQYGHGTHIAGLIAGDGKNSTGSKYSRTFQGIAPGANIVNLRVLDQNGQGSDSAVISAIGTAILLKPLFNIRVMNLSLGRQVYESYTLDPLCQAVEAAWKNGIVVVVSAGNNGRTQASEGYGTVTAPGNDPYVITVGAMKPMGTPTRTDDVIASYSSKGPTAGDAVVKPDVVAPGNLLVSLEAPNSTLYNEYPANQVPYSFYMNGGSNAPSSSYFTLSGTSMAAGVVSGAVADMLQKTPSLTPDQVKARLMKTAWKSLPSYSSYTDPVSGVTYTDQYDIFTVGAGYVDLEAAITNTDLAKGTAMSPIATFNAATNSVYLNDDPSSVWNTSATWANAAVWGASQFVAANGALTAASTNASTLSGTNALWGGSAPVGEN